MTIPDEALRAAQEATEGGFGITDDYMRAALTAALPFLQGVKVKDLRWKGPDSIGEYHSLNGLWGYIIRCGNGNGYWLTEIGQYYPTPEAAKAAAQADYEARVLSAIEDVHNAHTLADIGNPITDKSRLDNTARNLVLNRTHTDLENIINGHDPEVGNLNNDIWDRLDKMALEIEALSAPSPRAQALEEGALLNSAALIVEGRSTAINSEFIESLSNRKAWEVAEIIADHDIRLGSEIRALSSQPVDQEAKDFEAIGRAFMSCFEVITTELTEWFGYTPAECPSELVMDIFAAQQELKSSQPVADGWLPIETAPKDGTEFIGWDGKWPFRCSAGKKYELYPHMDGGPTYRDVWDGHYYDSLTIEHPTHWRPLPASPEVSG